MRKCCFYFDLSTDSFSFIKIVSFLCHSNFSVKHLACSLCKG